MNLFIFFIHFLSSLLACEISPKESLNFAISPEDQKFFSYAPSGKKNNAKFFSAINCSKISESNKYLMISFGPQNLELSDRIKAYDIANRYRDSGCFIQNSPFSFNDRFAERKKYLEQKWYTIQSCLEILVSDESSEVLNFPEKQPGCDYKILEKNKISFNGGFCFFRPNESSHFKIEFNVKEKCLNFEGLATLGIKVFDFQSVLNFYTTKEPSGDSLDLTSLASLPMRFTFAPNSNLFSISDKASSNEPQFPANYFLPETHMGIPEAEVSKPGHVKIRLPLWVNNKCERFCSENFCQGLCDYALPLAGNIEIYQLNKGKNIEMESTWFQGGVVSPQYQGEISGRTFEINDDYFKIGENYKIVMTFDDPKFDFDDLKKQFQKKFSFFSQRLPEFDHNTIPNLPIIRQIPITTTVPEMVTVKEIHFKKRLHEELEDLIANFSENFNSSFWPPFYQRLCSESKCISLNGKFMKLTQMFRVSSLDPITKKFEIEVYHLKRESTLLENYEENDPKMPQIICR